MPRRKPAARRPSRRLAKEAVAEPNAGEEEAKGPLVGVAPSQMINVDTAKRRDTGRMSVEKRRLTKNATHLADRLTQPSVGVKTLATARWGESI